MDPQVIEYLARVTSGLTIAEVATWLQARTPVKQVRDTWGPNADDVDEYLHVPQYDVKLQPGNDEYPPEQIEAIAYGPGYPGVVNQIRMGALELEVVASQLDARLTDDPDGNAINLIPIAALFGGDFLVLDYRREGAPTLGVWDHEASEDFAPSVTTVSSGFEAFVSSLR